MSGWAGSRHNAPMWRHGHSGWRPGLIAAGAALLALLTACGTAPPAGGPRGAGDALPARTARPAPATPADPGRDGVGPDVPRDLAAVPDAEPRIEPIRAGGANKPYEALGQRYEPATTDAPYRERGLASWYGRKFHGKRTASGEAYDMYAMTAAHPTLPLPSYVRVRNPANGAEVVLRVNDRGPFHRGRIIDLSYTAAVKLGVQRGVAEVEVERITFDDIRTGAWRRGGTTAVAANSVAPGAAPDVPNRQAPPVAPPPAAPPPAAPPSASPSAPPSTPSAMPVASPAAATTAVAAAAEAAVVAVAPAAPAPAAVPPPPAAPAPGFWVQLAAFQQRAGAEGFHRRVAADAGWLAPVLAVVADPSLYRLQAGPFASREEAQGVAQRVREALKLVPLVLERR